MMKGVRYLFLLALLVSSHAFAQEIRSLTPAQVAALLERPASTRVVPGEIIVKYSHIFDVFN